MATPKKIQYKDYADYLKSPKWKQVKQDYRDNESVEFCTLCHDVLSSENPPNYHHYKYSKDWNKDTWENLIIVCKPCHDLSAKSFYVSYPTGIVTIGACDGTPVSANVKTVSGDVSLQTGLSEGPYKFHAVSGEIRLLVPATF